MIFVTGDLHGEKEQIQEYIKVLSDCTKDDILIVAGDFGIPWYSRALDMHYKDDKLLDLLRNAPFTTCFVDGNHENFDLLYSNPVIEKWGGRVHDLDGIYHLMRGEIFTMENQTIFTFGGATSVDKQYRTPSISWWEQENSTSEEQSYAIENLKKHNFNVDYVITHQAPKQFIHIIRHLLFNKVNITCPTQEFLTKLKPKLTFKKWYFGHYHDDINSPIDRARLLFDEIVDLGT